MSAQALVQNHCMAIQRDQNWKVIMDLKTMQVSDLILGEKVLKQLYLPTADTSALVRLI